MKKIFLFLLVSIFFYSCGESKKTIKFLRLNDGEFNSSLYKLPDSIPASRKKTHDSCMGFSFDANAIFIKKRDTFFVGSIVNRQSLKVVNNIESLGFTFDQLIPKFNILTNPCYEKQTLHISLKSVLGDSFILKLPCAIKTVNDEINNYIFTAQNTEIRTGQWVYLDLKNAIINMMDTAKSSAFLTYKKNLLDSDNMFLAAIESITNVSFFVSTKKDISDQLQTILKQKPIVIQNSWFTVQLFFINSQMFQINIDGFFPVAGEFMKAEL